MWWVATKTATPASARAWRMSTGVLRASGEPLDAGDDEVVDLMGGHVGEKAAEARPVRAHPGVAEVSELVGRA
jgi:hypothetical protein